MPNLYVYSPHLCVVCVQRGQTEWAAETVGQLMGLLEQLSAMSWIISNLYSTPFCIGGGGKGGAFEGNANSVDLHCIAYLEVGNYGVFGMHDCIRQECVTCMFNKTNN